MPWTPLGFGKHSELTLPQILFKDPDWFFWAMENRVFSTRVTLPEANDINRKARNITIPDQYPDHIAQYAMHRPTEKFQELDLIKSGDHRTVHATYKRTIDLSTPREFAGYDKSGCRHLIHNVKFYLFGSRSAKMTRQRCEEFFDNPANFS